MTTQLPETAFIVDDTAKPGERIGIVRSVMLLPLKSTGYVLTDLDNPDDTLAQVEARVQILNLQIGIDDKTAIAMKIGSMFGERAAYRHLFGKGKGE